MVSSVTSQDSLVKVLLSFFCLVEEDIKNLDGDLRCMLNSISPYN